MFLPIIVGFKGFISSSELIQNMQAELSWIIL